MAEHKTTQAEKAGTNSSHVENAVKLVGEALLPGASLLIDGKILQGGAHAIVGTLARVALGPIGLVLVAANSYSTSSTGKSLLKHFTKDDKTS